MVWWSLRGGCRGGEGRVRREKGKARGGGGAVPIEMGCIWMMKRRRGRGRFGTPPAKPSLRQSYGHDPSYTVEGPSHIHHHHHQQQQRSGSSRKHHGFSHTRAAQEETENRASTSSSPTPSSGRREIRPRSRALAPRRLDEVRPSCSTVLALPHTNADLVNLFTFDCR